MDGSALARAMANTIATLIIIAFAIGVGMAFAIPWLWGLLRPWLHAITAGG